MKYILFFNLILVAHLSYADSRIIQTVGYARGALNKYQQALDSCSSVIQSILSSAASQGLQCVPRNTTCYLLPVAYCEAGPCAMAENIVDCEKVSLQ